MTEGELKGLIFGAAGCSVIFGVCLVYFAFGTLLCMDSIVFLLLGAFAIMSAMLVLVLVLHSFDYLP